MLKLFESTSSDDPLGRYLTVNLALQILIIGNLFALLLRLGNLELFGNYLFKFKLPVCRAWILVHFLELAHEFDVLEGVYLQLGQLVVEAPFADLNRFGYIRLQRELFGGRLAVQKCTLSFEEELAVGEAV